YLRKRLENIPFEAVFSSPKKRAVQTCGPIQHQLDPNLCEWDYGDYEGKTWTEIQQINPGWTIFDQGAPHGESPEQVGQRADAVLHKILTYSGNVALFSHGHFLRVLTARFLGMAPEMGKLFLLSVASISILGFERRQPVMQLWNSSQGF
ncbi:MAG: histidine phosphatase family protein, partial [Verrucomicrobia bacterium]|nr:histidine phosphatase family protein [Verrucomicrobiota bacterium]